MFAKVLEERNKANEGQMTYYAAALSGLLGIFILWHLGRLLAQRGKLASRAPALAIPFLALSR